MGFDFETMARRLAGTAARPVAGATREVTAAMVEDMARRLAERGYRPTAGGLAAAEQYLRGHGLWLVGDVGTGKTAFFRALGVTVYPMTLTVGRTVEGVQSWFMDNRDREIVLDDIGSEPVFNNFGSRYEILPLIIDERMRARARTHITSNVNARAVLERYGARTLDRMAELCVRVEFKGASMRRPRVDGKEVA